MVKMVFYIQFRDQLVRTRPDLIAFLEHAVAASASVSGGAVEYGRRVLSASFNEDRIGFWLDMAIFLEKAHGDLEKAAPELYGYALVLGRDVGEGAVRTLCRLGYERHGRGGGGIWCTAGIREALEFYIGFTNPLPGGDSGIPGGVSGVGTFRMGTDGGDNFPYRDAITRALAREEPAGTLLVGSCLEDLRDGIRRYCEGFLRDVPPLEIRFARAAGCSALVCVADAYTPAIRSFVTASLSAGAARELDELHSLLFMERLRGEWSPYTREKCRVFIRSLLSAYGAAAKARGRTGALILENIAGAGKIPGWGGDAARQAPAGTFQAGKTHADGRGAAGIFPAEILREIGSSALPVFCAENAAEEDLGILRELFPRILKFPSGDADSADTAPERANSTEIFPPEIFPPDAVPHEIYEVAYNSSLLGRFFPEYLIPQLFEEQGLNREMYFRSLRVVSAPALRDAGAPYSRAEKIPEERAEKVRAAVRSRLLDWVLRGKLRPCFGFLARLSELGGEVPDALVLISLRADVRNGTWEEIEDAAGRGRFDAIVGTANAPFFTHIYKTLKALVWGDRDAIDAAFQEPAPGAAGESCYAGCRAQTLINRAVFYLGGRNTDAALETVREALILNRELGEDAVPAYRLFALANIARQCIDDAMEYISYALEQARKSGQSEEMIFTRYYAASINLLYGNLSKAAAFAAEAEETAYKLGQPGWGQKARFLRGRICFETGRYSDALEFFESLDSGDGGGTSGGSDMSGGGTSGGGQSSGGCGTAGEMTATIRAWIFRAKNFMGRVTSPEESAALTGLDARIFEMEAAYFATDYKRTVALADQFLSSGDSVKDGFIFTEQPDWRSGFSQCEFMFQSERTLGTRMVWIYRAMALAALNPSLETRTEILGGMQRFMREELLPDTDPKDAFYFYAWYCMLRDTKAAQVDMNTIVSMAFKRLRRRAERIADREVKRAFLNLPRWNNALYLAAREYKLV